MKSMAKTVRLEDWSVTFKADPYQAPELIRSRLQGKVYGHQRFEDGTFIFTSPIVRGEHLLIITESGTCYELGKIDPEYEKKFPDATNRLFKSLRDLAARESKS